MNANLANMPIIMLTHFNYIAIFHRYIAVNMDCKIMRNVELRRI